MFDGEAAREGANKKSEKQVTDPANFQTNSNSAANNATATGNTTNQPGNSSGNGGEPIIHDGLPNAPGMGQTDQNSGN